MNYKNKAGIDKKSFELNFNGGSIWAEHLDSMGTYADEVISKFLEDYKTFSRASISSFMIINLDETNITDEIVSCIVSSMLGCSKQFMKVAFVGVDKKYREDFKQLGKSKGTLIKFMNDYEKAKQWLLHYPTDS